MNAVAATLLGSSGQAVPLTSVRASGRLDGFLFELTVEQHYQNSTDQPLECVYTFPLPLHAELLGFEVELNGQCHTAIAVARKQAESRYEEAIDGGDSAALLVQNGNGLYTVQLANLLPGEHAVIRYRYAELLDTHHGYMRLAIPTVIAPRYGHPQEAHLEGPAVPGVELLAEYPFELAIELIGLSDPIAVRSLSHHIGVTPTETGLRVTLSRQGFLDRDFILELDESVVPKEVLVAADGAAFVALASPVLTLDRDDQEPLALKILVDCSGSMAGESIEAAKSALLRLLDRLEATDRISFTRFGSRTEHVSEGMETADLHTVRPLAALVAALKADLGGTEMLAALKATLAIPAPAGSHPDLMLITDGEVHNVDAIAGIAASSRHRLFVLAIGAAPNEALARRVTEATGGACEFIAGAKDIEASVLRMFSRLRSSPRTLSGVTWSTEPAWIAPYSKTVFPGDSLRIMAGFSERPAGRVTVAISDSSGRSVPIELPLAKGLTPGDTVARLAAARRLISLPESDALALAVKYQLASKYTSLVLVIARDASEKAGTLPATIAVPQMLAKGWGGLSGSADYSLGSSGRALPAARGFAASCLSLSLDDFGAAPGALPGPASRPPQKLSLGELDALLRALQKAHAAGTPMPTSFEQLGRDYSAPRALIDALSMLLFDRAGHSEARCIAAFLVLLAQHSRQSIDAEFLQHLNSQFSFDRKTRRLRERIIKEILP